MKKFILFILMFTFVTPVLAQKSVILPQICDPQSIVVDNGQIYIVEYTSIYIYSTKDFKLQRKIGKEGEGPQEFRPRPGIYEISINVEPDYLLVKSVQRLSYFTRDGEYKKEINYTGNYFDLMPLGEQFLGSKGIIDDNKTLYFTISICDSQFNETKQIYKQKHFFQFGENNLNTLLLARQRRPLYFSHEDKIIVEGENDTILIFDKNGEKLCSIKANYDKLEVTESHKKATEDYFILIRSSVYQRLKKQFQYPKYFPIIRRINVADKKIYVIPYKKKQGKSEIYIYDLEGKLLKKTLLPLSERDVINLFPYTIANGKVYQLIEDLDKEEWSLHITEIK